MFFEAKYLHSPIIVENCSSYPLPITANDIIRDIQSTFYNS